MRAASISAIQQGPAGVIPAVVVTMFVASGAAAVILTVVPEGPQPALNEWVRVGAAVLCAALGIGYSVSQARSPRLSPAVAQGAGPSDAAATAGLLSLAAMSLLLLVPVYLLAARTHPPTEEWLGYGFFDKRWVLAAFLLGTLGAMMVLAAAGQLVRAAQAKPDSSSAWLGKASGPAAEPGREIASLPAGWKRWLGLTAAALALAAYFYAPPWHVGLSEVNLHETPMMAGVQAIAHGSVPYIDAAAVQYGPGSEIAHYLYLQGAGFNVASLRESTVLLYWLAASIFFVTIFLRLPFKLALISSFAAVLLFPTLQMIGFQPDGSVDNQITDVMDGSWGWPNAMRYVGVFALAMWFPVVAANRARVAALAAGVGLGLFWGLTCFISQENLPGGVLALGALAALLAITQTIPPRRLLAALGRVGIGFLVVVLAVFAYYAAQGELARFLELYYLIPPAVAAGYSNTVYFEGFGGLWGHMYFLLPGLLCLLCVLSILKLHPPRVARAWSPERVLLVSALIASVVSHLGAIPRADAPHLFNTMLALPVALVLAAAYLPRLLQIQSSGRRRVLTAAVLAAPLALMPLSQITEVPDRLRSPLARFSYESPALEWQRVSSDSIAARRLTPDVLRRPGQWCCTHFSNPTSMREFATILNRLNRIVGDRRVYVANFIEELHPGGAYFLADLKPSPILFEPLTMAMNQRLLDEFLDFYEAHLSETEAVVAVYPDLPEVEMFAKAYPEHTRTEIRYQTGTITVLTR